MHLNILQQLFCTSIIVILVQNKIINFCILEINFEVDDPGNVILLLVPMINWGQIKIETKS